MSSAAGRDLVVLVADADARAAMLGLLVRHQALGIRPLRLADDDVIRFTRRDSGCASQAHEFLRLYLSTHGHALVVFDHEGSGQEARTAVDLERDVELRLSGCGWQGRCAAIVLEPELEAWVWSDSPQVAAALGWGSRSPGLRDWMVSKQLVAPDSLKPPRPKEAMQSALRVAGLPFSPSTFKRLADQVSLHRCRDRAFLKLKATLQAWFSPTQVSGPGTSRPG